jgi:hypothetical protein
MYGHICLVDVSCEDASALPGICQFEFARVGLNWGDVMTDTVFAICNRRFDKCRDLLNEAGLHKLLVRNFLGASLIGLNAALLAADWLDSDHAYTLLKAKLALRG